jgi:hypothetical protein
VLIYDLVDPVELAGFVRTIQPPTFTLGQFLPAQPIDDLEYRFTRGDFDDQDVAPFRAFDAEAPIGTRPGVARVSGELPPISKKMRLGEEQRLRLRGLTNGAGATQQLAAAVFADADNLTRSVLARVELARGQALYDGRVTIAENGVAAEVDYGFTAGQRVTVGTSWADPAADIVGDLTSMVEAYVARTGGEAPGVLVVSGRVRGFMLRNDAIRALSASLAGGPQLVTVEALGATLRAFDLPQIVVNDTAVKVAGVRTRVIPDDRALLLPAGGGNQLGRTFFGTTAEALELVGAQQMAADQAPGLVGVVEKTFDPVATWTKVAAIALPVIANPELVTTARVLV